MAFVIQIIVGEFYTIEANHLSHPVLSRTRRVRVDIQMRGDTWMICVSSHHPLRAVVYIPEIEDNNNNLDFFKYYSFSSVHDLIIWSKCVQFHNSGFTLSDSTIFYISHHLHLCYFDLHVFFKLISSDWRTDHSIPVSLWVHRHDVHGNGVLLEGIQIVHFDSNRGEHSPE